MWEGKWTKELSSLYEVYYNIFGAEPDVDQEIDFDSISFTAYQQALKKSILYRRPIEALIG